MITFVAGPPRSGTTMLLSAVSEGRILPECSIIASMILHRLQFSPESDREKFTSFFHNDTSLDGCVADFMERVLDSVVGGVSALKSPELAHLLPHLHRFFRRPIRTICLVRDPRDVIASLMTVRDRQGASRDVVAAADYIGGFFDNIAVALDRPNPGNPLLLVRYEDFVMSRRARDEVERFIGRPINRGGVLERQLAPDNPWHSDLYSKPITAERIGSYRDYLTPDEIGAIDESYARFYERFAYARHEEMPGVKEAA